ncbi:hypothetical protein [Zavarzinia sp. CC-PAN008]|uniref:hypothetical protein n=1 Tax=Zavarzinia sp. CC-PAN008 TaxID=3243332 RepID=UPI003F745284
MVKVDAAVFAHSLPGLTQERWAPLAARLQHVGERAACFGHACGWERVARLAGRQPRELAG